MIHIWLSQILQNLQSKNENKVFSRLSFESKEIIISYCLRLLAQSKCISRILYNFFQGERKIEGYKQYKEKNIFIQLHKEYNEVISIKIILNILIGGNW